MRLNNMRGNVTINIMKFKSITLFFAMLLTTASFAVAPTFTSVSPGSLPQGAIDELTIVGTNFQSGITVEITGGGYCLVSDNISEWDEGWTTTPEFFCEVTPR